MLSQVELDEPTLREFVRNLSLHYAKRSGMSLRDADDLEQEGLIAVWKEGLTMENPAYVRVVVRNAMIDWIRKVRGRPGTRRGRPVTYLDETLSSGQPRVAFLVAEVPSVEDEVIERVCLSSVLKRLANLPKRQREAVTARVHGKYTQRELADKWGVTEGRVSQIRSQALAELSW